MYTQFDSSVEQVSRPAEARTEVQEEPVMAVPAGNDSDGTHAEPAQGASRDHSIAQASQASHHPLYLHKDKTEAAGMEDPCNWVAKWKECPACLIPLCYVSQNQEERKKHMIQCDGANLDFMFDPVCPNRGHCNNRDVDHWSTKFHKGAPKEDVRPITNLHNRNWLT